MSYYKVGDRVRVINGIGKLQDAMRGRVGTVAAVYEANGVEYYNILIDGFDNPHTDDPTIMFYYNELAPWLGDSEGAKEIALSRYLRYKTNWCKKEGTKYCTWDDVITTKEVFNAIRTVQTVIPKIKDVIYNDPATIVFWEDGTKTVVKCKNEKFDPEKGLAMAFSKKMLGNKGNYYNIFKKWLPKEEKSESADIIKDISSKIGKPKPQTFTFDLKPIVINKKLFEALTGAPSGTTIQFEDAKEEPKRNPVEEFYKKLVDHRDNNGEINFDELIGLLGEALDD